MSALPCVVHLTRPPGAGDYSVERCFQALRDSGRLTSHEVRLVPCRYPNRGIVNRLLNCIHAWRSRGEVNHILGDVHYLALFLPKKRTMLTILDCRVAFHSDPIRRAMLRLFWLTMPVRRAAQITVISEATKAEVLRLTGISPSRVRVLPVCISDRLQPKPRVFRAECPEILQIGTRPNKNVPRLVEALEGVRCRLHIVGPLDAALEAALQRHRVDYRNSVNATDDEIAEAYETCDMVTFLSTYEGFGMPVVEAQAVGRVVVTSSLEPMRSVSGGAAFFANPMSVDDIRRAIAEAIGNASAREAAIEAGFSNALLYRAGRVAEAYADAYREMRRACES